jgi:integrase
MFLSKLPNGIYHIYYFRGNGKKTKISTHTRHKSEAYKFLANFEREFKLRQQNKLTPIDLKKLRFEFLKYSESIHSINHTNSLKTTFNEFMEFTGNIPASELSKKTIQEFVEIRLRTVSNYTVRRDLADLSSAFNWAISKNYLFENPCRGIKKPKLVEKLPLFFTQAEFNTLLESIKDNDLKDLIHFAVLTGIRQNDLITLRWNQINFKNRTLTFDNRLSQTKSRKIHTLPLNLKALQILTGRELKRKSDFVFTCNQEPIKQCFISHKFKKLVIEAKLNPLLTFHSLRHSFGSWLVQKGVPIYQVSKLMTHSDLRVTQIYTHLSEQNLKEAVELLND